eukprot:scaffold190079_cov49-Attheya_sp.AAC.1
MAVIRRPHASLALNVRRGAGNSIGVINLRETQWQGVVGVGIFVIWLLARHLASSNADTSTTVVDALLTWTDDGAWPAVPLLTVVVLTMDRVKSLKRLLRSLETAHYDQKARIRLVIQVDHSKQNGACLSLAQQFPWKYGPKVVHISKEPLGLARSWFQAWRPYVPGDVTTPKDNWVSKVHCDDYLSVQCQRAIILEDDIELSPAWYMYLQSAWNAYPNRMDLAGVTLQRQELVPLLASRRNEQIVNNHEPFLYPLLGSIGFSPHPKHWNDFLSWVRDMPNPFEADVMTPDLITSSWYTDLERGTMWTQHFIYFTKTRHVEQTGVELCTLYINLRDNFTLATHHREKGVHVTGAAIKDFPAAPFDKLVVNFPAEPQKYDWDAKPVVPTKSDRLRTVNKVALGSTYGEWTYDASRLNSKSIVYSVGVGLDTTWDEALLRRHPGLRIWAFDPTPGAAKHVIRKRHSSDPNEDILLRDRFHFTPEGLTAKEDVHVEKFTKPLDPAHISMKEGEFSGLGDVIEVNVSTLKHWLEQFNREHFDILKMDIEGTEYDVLEKCLEDDFFPFDQLLLEWHGLEKSETVSRRETILDALTNKGFISIAESSGGKEMSFIRAPVDSTTETGTNVLSTSLVGASKPKPEIKAKKKEKSETMPSLKENKLTIAAAKDVAKKNNGVVILQLLNEGYITMTLSWICNVRQFDVLSHTLFVTTDQGAYDALTQFDSKLQVILRPYESKQELDYGQHEYFAYMLFRTRLIVDLLENSVTVWLVESDAVWLQDPTPI